MSALTLRKTSDTPFCLEAASIRDAWFIRALLEDRAPSVLPLPYDTIRANIDDFAVIRCEGRVVACVWACVIDEERVELRSLAVERGWHGRNLGSVLVMWCITQGMLGRRHVVCVTDKPRFFERFGFHRIALDSLPDKPLRSIYPAASERVALELPTRGIVREGGLYA